ncbi:hypothetical protein WN55_04384, partial [Dufourea novaeangliae]
SSFSTDSTSKLNVLGHDGHSLGVDGTQIGIFEKTNKVGLAGFLKGHDGRALETQVGFEVLGDFTDKSLERQFPDQKFSAFLVSTDFTESNGSWTITVRLLHSSGSRCTFTSGLCSQLFPWCFTTGRFPCSLLGTSHRSWSARTTKLRVLSARDQLKMMIFGL